jgi:hypothetical protein
MQTTNSFGRGEGLCGTWEKKNSSNVHSVWGNKYVMWQNLLSVCTGALNLSGVAPTERLFIGQTAYLYLIRIQNSFPKPLSNIYRQFMQLQTDFCQQKTYLLWTNATRTVPSVFVFDYNSALTALIILL